jgi:hypothetical protein
MRVAAVQDENGRGKINEGVEGGFIPPSPRI